MSRSLPIGDYRWMTGEEITQFDVNTISDDSNRGYILEVTLNYPQHLHKSHSSYPLAAEKLSVADSDLSPYAADCLKKFQKQQHKGEKLSATFNPRVKYVCHGLNLQLYLKLGLELVTIHRGISFRQEKFLKQYVDMCTKKRAAAVTKARSNMFKLLCNSLYGKMIEGSDKRLDCHFNFTRAQAVKRNTNPRLTGTMICNEDASISFFKKREIFLNQSWAVGFSILELSKHIMQSLYYEEIKPAFNNEVTVLMSDTDSWIVVVKSPSEDAALAKIQHVMDFSNYPVTHPFHDSARKNQVGFLKNELPAQKISRAVMLRSKVYMYQTQEGKTDLKCKGVRKAVKKKIPIERLIRCLTHVNLATVKQQSIRSMDHVNMIVESKRVAFSSYDEKRYLLCPLHSVPYGSVLIDYLKNKHACYICDHPNEML